MIRSNDPEFTVSPEVLASNLVVMGSVPPVVSLEDAEDAVAHHGLEYALALFDALEARGRKVTREPEWVTAAKADQPALTGPVAPAVTERLLDLFGEASQTLAQAAYEGSARRRQDPAPSHGSPWTTPDLPDAVQAALKAAQDAVSALITAAASA